MTDIVGVFDATQKAATYIPLMNALAEALNAGNFILNGGFSIKQEAPASNADDTYAHDGWYALTQTGAIAVSTQTNVEDGMPYMARLTQSQASAQRMGYAQIIESAACIGLRGEEVTFRINRMRLSTSANVRFAVLEWTGTANSVTSDVVLDWTSGTYTANAFFLAASLTVTSVTQQALTAATLTDGDAVTVTLGSSFNNLVVFVWTEGTAAQNVTFDIGKVQLNKCQFATHFDWPNPAIELVRCQRHYRKSFPQATAPAQRRGGHGGDRHGGAAGGREPHAPRVPFRRPDANHADDDGL